MSIHKTAIISSKANIAKGVAVGPYAVIEEDTEIGQETIIGPHVRIHKGTRIGRQCRIHTGACLGDEPQDLNFKGEKSFVEIGDRNVFREYVTVHRGTEKGSATEIGNDNYFMAFAHIAHNCCIGDNVIVCNNTLLGGHVRLEDRAFLSAGCLLHQFVRVGKVALTGGGVRLNKDIPPYMMSNNNNIISGYNVVGLRRAGIKPQARSQIKEAFRILYRSGLNLSNALAEIEKARPGPEVRHLVEFIRSSKRGICFTRSNQLVGDASQTDAV
jgi:UDP-N-acetylglucosamine acyltransferase